jgi:hypothetical protein
MTTEIRHRQVMTQIVTSSLELRDYNVAYLLKARIVEPEKQPLLANGCVTRNNEVTVEAVFSVRSVPLQRSLETAVRRGGGWCEMAASLRGREPRSRGASTGEDTAD